MLHDGYDDLVAGAQRAPAQCGARRVHRQAMRHQVEHLAGVAAKDHLVAGAGLGGHAVRAVGAGHAQVRGDCRTGLLDGLGRLDREAVEPAQRVGVHGLVEAPLRVEHGGGALRGGGAVKKGQLWVSRKQGEVLLVGALVDVGCHVCLPSGSHSASAWVSASSFATSSPSASRAKAMVAARPSRSACAAASSTTARENSSVASRSERPRQAR